MAKKDGEGIGSTVIAVMILLTQILVLLVFIPTDMIDRTWRVEVRMLESLYSADTVKWIAESTYSVYSLLIEQTGISEGISWALLPENRADTGVDSIGSNFWFPYLEGRGKALQALMHLILIRVVALSVWIPLYILIMIPSILDGVFERSIKRYTFRYPSPLAHRMGVRTIGVTFFLVMVGLLSPIPVPPLILPVTMALAIATMGIAVIGNLPKKL